jgi:hypothetical protein
MKDDLRTSKQEITPVRLHLKLSAEYMSDDGKRMLRRYGEAPDGVITRDILVPSDMPLHNLHYTIQKLFGWQNFHLRMFYLPEKLYIELTKGTVSGWADLVGILFQPPSEAEEDVFWDDDYESGSIMTWLKRKYTGPYSYGGTMERPEMARRDIEALLDRFNPIKVRESFSDYMDRKEKDPNTQIRILKAAPLSELTLEEMNASLMMDGGTLSLMERLEVDHLLASEHEVTGSESIFPVTRELLYDYDFGDHWTITITKHSNCDDLLRNNIISIDELNEAMEKVVRLHRPVCIDRQGLSVMDDVGGLNGFADLLATIYEEEDKVEAAETRTWAKGMGWSAAKVSIKKML